MAKDKQQIAREIGNEIRRQMNEKEIQIKQAARRTYKKMGLTKPGAAVGIINNIRNGQFHFLLDHSRYPLRDMYRIAVLLEEIGIPDNPVLGMMHDYDDRFKFPPSEYELGCKLRGICLVYRDSNSYRNSPFLPKGFSQICETSRRDQFDELGFCPVYDVYDNIHEVQGLGKSLDHLVEKANDNI
jgi:hypothetical protein